MEKVLTADKSETFLNKDVGESYHSFTGAVEEALKKFVKPTKIKELAKTGEIKILDVCFGLGYNSAMAINVALQENPNCKIEVIGLESDIEIIKKIQEVNPDIAYYKNYKLLKLKKSDTTGEYTDGMLASLGRILENLRFSRLAISLLISDPALSGLHIDKRTPLVNTLREKEYFSGVPKALPLGTQVERADSKNLSFTKDNVTVKILLGDAKEQVKTLPNNYFDTVFFDPFSPKTAPEMWTADFFKDVREVMKKGAILATYSCARMVRDNMAKAGLEYSDGPRVGRRGPGTIAIKK